MNICLFAPEEIHKPLKADDSRAVHIKKILRKGAGDSFAAGIIGGMAGTATITKIGGSSAGEKLSQDQNAGALKATIGQEAPGDIYFDFVPQSDGKPLFPLEMIIGFPRPIQLKRLLRDMAALGVSAVRLCGTELGEKSYLESRLSSTDEVYKMLLDGTVQAGSVHVPKPFVYPTLAECLDDIEAKETVGSQKSQAVGRPQADKGPKSAALKQALNKNLAQGKDGGKQKGFGALKIALDNINPAQSLAAFLKANPPAGRKIFAAIGSERGWSPAERSLLEERGWTRLGMGNRVMRTETAATVGASLVLSELGALG